MTHTTITQVEGAAAHVNELLRDRGSTARVIVQGRNGGTALDLGYGDTPEGPTVGIARLLTFGTTGEVWRYLDAMRQALMIAREYQPDDNGKGV